MEASALRSGLRSAPRFPGPLRRIAGDERLVELMRAGSEDAFEVVFDRYHRQLLSFCRHMLGSREEAEDAVQHTFMAAYNALTESDKPIQLRPWLYTIARNHCFSLLRARREQASLEDVEPAVEGLAAEVQRRADLRDMLRDLGRLPFDQRAALVLSELGALSHDEIADVLGCPKEKVKALVFQARSSLSASREARDTSCAEIREQLATLTGGALRRSTLRRHLRECPGCREFGDEVKRQRRAMAVLLPVVPTAGLKSSLMSAVAAKVGGGGGGIGGGGLAAAGAGAGGTAVSAGGGGLGALVANLGIAKLVIAGALVVGGGAATVAAVETIKPERKAPSGASGSGGAPGEVTPSGVRPTRAYGEHAPGKQTGGVANGKNPKGKHGRSETAPGKAGTAPGKAGTAPGRAGTTPGRAGTTPGKAGTAPGRSRADRIESRRGSSVVPGRTRTNPGTTRRPSSGTESGGSGGGGSGGGSDTGTGTQGSSGSGGAGGSSGVVPSGDGSAGARRSPSVETPSVPVE